MRKTFLIILAALLVLSFASAAYSQNETDPVGTPAAEISGDGSESAAQDEENDPGILPTEETPTAEFTEQFDATLTEESGPQAETTPTLDTPTETENPPVNNSGEITETAPAETEVVPAAAASTEIPENPTEGTPTEEVPGQLTETPAADLTEQPTDDPQVTPENEDPEPAVPTSAEGSDEVIELTPTPGPTEETNEQPTEIPSETPSDVPLLTPSEEPTAISPASTPDPTDVITTQPTEEQTSTPTPEPEITPTEELTGVPTEETVAEITDTPAPDVTVKITGNVSRVTYNGQEYSVSGFTAEADNPDYDVNHDFVFRRDVEPTAERTGTGITYLGLTKDDFINTNPAFGNVFFDVTDGYIEILPIDVIVEIEGRSDSSPDDGEPHSVEGYEIKSIVCSFNSPDEQGFTIYDCQAYTPEDFVFSGEAFAERSEPGITWMGLLPEHFENVNINFENVTFQVKDGYQEIVSPQGSPAGEETQERKVTIFSSLKPNFYNNEEIVLSAHLEGFGSCSELRYQWECDRGDGFLPVESGDKATLSYPANTETLAWKWQLTVFCK